ncbi:MAG: hypothetical protein IJ513_08130 [Bacteroidaceae bacterium]|nr:hypothetical protein [Bacteroidaceae bacterium]
MNKQVEDFINKMKEEQKGEDLKQREEHLISLGLIDEEKTKRGIVYLDNWDGTKDCKFDNEKNKYYKESFVPAAIEITDEEYQEILKYAPIDKTETHEEKTKTKWANIIKTTSNVFLVLIIICGLISAFEFGPVTLIYVIIYAMLYYPMAMGFAKIVESAEKKL